MRAGEIMQVEDDGREPRLRGAWAWIVSGLALVFLALAVFLALRPDWGGELFGITASGADARGYIRAVAIRDLALSLYMLALIRFASRRAVAILLGVTVVIPLCDLALLAVETGRLTPFHAAVHGASALTFAALSLALFWRERPERRQGSARLDRDARP